MGYMRFNYKSRALGRYVDVTVLMPTENYTYAADNNYSRHGNAKPVRLFEPGMKFQTVYVIHGGGDDDTMVTRYTNIERYARENNVMVVAPNVVHSFGVNTRYGVDYSDFICIELPIVIQTLFASSPKREDNFIVGFAMGGNAALASAILHPEKFAVCVDMSGGIGATMDTEMFKDELRNRPRADFPLVNSTFGDPDKIDGSDLDLYYHAKKNLEEKKELCKIIVICGSEEFIKKRVARDVAKLEELGYDYEYIEPEGYKHDWVLWDHYLQVILDEILPLERKK